MYLCADGIFVSVNEQVTCLQHFSTPFDGGSLEETKANILKQDVIPLYEPELLSLAGEVFIQSCLWCVCFTISIKI